jgi:hypothetical protein
MFSLLALADLTASSLPAEISTFYWGSQTPVRLLFFFVVTAYSYVFKQGGEGVGGSVERNRLGRGLLGGGKRWGGDELKNGLVFSWGFVEMLCWFWVSRLRGVFALWKGFGGLSGRRANACGVGLCYAEG